MKKILYFLLYLSLVIFSFSFFSFANELESEGTTKPQIETRLLFDVLPMNLEEIVNDAGKIFSGKCIKAEDIKKDPKSELHVIKYTFKVIEGIKGVGEKKEITFKQWHQTAGTSGYTVGGKYFLFLYPESELGLTGPAGVSQGKFDIEEKKFIRRKETVKNKLNNRGLYRNLKTRKEIQISKDKFINDYVKRCSELGIPMRYQEFSKAIKYLVEK